ncbi:MAG: chemotaxis protein [Burkholderiaceae bacterium]
MATSSLDPSADRMPDVGKGRDVKSLGPSDSSDSGSDTQGARRTPQDIDSPLDQHALPLGPDEMEGDSDRFGSGERASADGDAKLTPDADIRPDHEQEVTADDNTSNDAARQRNPVNPRQP